MYTFSLLLGQKSFRKHISWLDLPRNLLHGNEICWLAIESYYWLEISAVRGRKGSAYTRQPFALRHAGRSCTPISVQIIRKASWGRDDELGFAGLEQHDVTFRGAHGGEDSTRNSFHIALKYNSRLLLSCLAGRLGCQCRPCHSTIRQRGADHEWSGRCVLRIRVDPSRLVHQSWPLGGSQKGIR